MKVEREKDPLMGLMTLVCPERVRTRKVTRNSCVLHVMKGFREEFSVIKDGDGKCRVANLAVWAKRGKWYFNIQLLGKGENENISWD